MPADMCSDPSAIGLGQNKGKIEPELRELLAQADRDIHQEERRLAAQAAEVAVLAAKGGSTIIAEAVLGAMESRLSALQTHRDLLVARAARVDVLAMGIRTPELTWPA